VSGTGSPPARTPGLVVAWHLVSGEAWLSLASWSPTFSSSPGLACVRLDGFSSTTKWPSGVRQAQSSSCLTLVDRRCRVRACTRARAPAPGKVQGGYWLAPTCIAVAAARRRKKGHRRPSRRRFRPVTCTSDNCRSCRAAELLSPCGDNRTPSVGFPVSAARPISKLDFQLNAWRGADIARAEERNNGRSQLSAGGA
jgi:hypothetical protein